MSPPLPKIAHLQRHVACLGLAAAILLYLSFQAQIHLFGNGLAQKSMPNSRFIIKLLTFNRLQSLSNCLESLSTADYEGDIVTLHIFVDHFEREGAAKASTIDKQLQEAHELLHYIDSLIGLMDQRKYITEHRMQGYRANGLKHGGQHRTMSLPLLLRMICGYLLCFTDI